MLALSPKEIKEQQKEIGAKTINLAILKNAGHNVPNFLAIPASVIRKFYHQANGWDEVMLDDVVKEIVNALPSQTYAVRSSALIEDNNTQSFAGQFSTKINQSPQNLAQAIKEVISQSWEFLGKTNDKFSLLVQSYIEADISGITFTRNPTGSHEMIIEFFRGKGEELVGGRIKPSRIGLYWYQDFPRADVPRFDKVIRECQRIESLFAFPQDIEWCIRDDSFYILQSRPVTTISFLEYQGYQYLDTMLGAQGKPFLYEKTEISEIAPRPTPITQDILTLLYAENGPVQGVYKKYGIVYQPDNFLKIIGNELYIDRQKELKTLLPAFSYFGKDFLKPQSSALWGFLKTTRNLSALKNINATAYNTLVGALKEALGRKESKGSFGERLQDFLKEYEIIFEINLIAAKLFHALDADLGKESIATTELLQANIIKEADEKLSFEMNNTLGNSFELADTTPFFATPIQQKDNNELKQWWSNLLPKHRERLSTILKDTRRFVVLREYARWLTVKHISALREDLLDISKKKLFSTNETIYFVTLAEVQNNTITESRCRERKQSYQQFNQFAFPKRLASTYIEDISASKPLGVSGGRARGILASEQTLTQFQAPRILYTRILSPQLTKYFGEIAGIISDQGSLLSHLAIVAREVELPVIVNVNIAQLGIKEGDTIEIDGSLGTIKKIR